MAGNWDREEGRGGGDRWRGGEGRHRGSSIFSDDEQDRSGGMSGSGNTGGRDDHGFLERAGEEVRSWFGADDERGPGEGAGRAQGGWSGGGEPWGGGDWAGNETHGHRGNQGRQSFSGSHPDDHYRSWRDRQIEQMDRDYEEYCRERQQSFHGDFDSWRRSRQSPGDSGLGTSASTGSSAPASDSEG